jgi:hypothetical protein
MFIIELDSGNKEVMHSGEEVNGVRADVESAHLPGPVLSAPHPA